MTNKQENEVLILGGVTHDNRGDLAMMEGLLRELGDKASGAVPVLYSWNPERSRSAFNVDCRMSPDLDISSRFARKSGRFLAVVDMGWFLVRFVIFRFVSYRLASWITRARLLGFFAQLSRAKAIVIPGSGSFNSYWWHDWLYPKTACAVAARLAGKPVIMSSQGVGPFDHALDRMVAAQFCRAGKFFGVRDAGGSAEILRTLGAFPERIWHTGDDALLVSRLSRDRSAVLLEEEGIGGDEVLIGVNVRDASAYSSSFKESGTENVAAALKEVAARHGARLVFIPISYDSWDDDRESAERMADAVGGDVPITIIRNERSAAELRAIIGAMSACVGTSYHFLLFALTEAVPSMGLFRNQYYQHKQTGLFGLFGQTEWCLDVSLMTAEVLAERMEMLFARRREVSSALADANAAREEEVRQARVQLVRTIGIAIGDCGG